MNSPLVHAQLKMIGFQDLPVILLVVLVVHHTSQPDSVLSLLPHSLLHEI